MEELVRILSERLPPGAVRLKERADAVVRDGAGWKVSLSDGSALHADALILAVEAYQAARLTRYLDPGLSHLLETIPYAASATVSLAYRRGAVAHPLDGFGFVVPRSEGRPILACTFSSVKYPGRAPDGFVLLRLFLGGALNEAVLRQSDEQLVAQSHSQVAELLGVTASPLLSRVHRFPASMAQYQLGHLERVAAVERRAGDYPGLALAGSAYRGVGIADCIRSGEEAAEQVFKRLGFATEE